MNFWNHPYCGPSFSDSPKIVGSKNPIFKGFFQHCDCGEARTSAKVLQKVSGELLEQLSAKVLQKVSGELLERLSAKVLQKDSGESLEQLFGESGQHRARCPANVAERANEARVSDHNTHRLCITTQSQHTS